jgi:phosphatidate cytidylyltransferase
MFVKRLLTACIGIPLAIYLINQGGLLYASAITLIASLAWYEYYRMMACKQIAVPFTYGLISLLLLLSCAWFGNSHELLAIIILSYLSVLSLTVLRCSSFSINSAAYTIMGITYIGLPFAHLLLLRLTDATMSLPSYWGGSLSAGAVYLWLAFTGTWANDTFAFFVGSKWGRNKLCPGISPGKTKEGAAGGIVGTILVVMAFGSIYGLPLVHLFLIGCLVGIAAPLGDLTESALKRYTGVKDSGRLLPGHGGVLDRFDSIMFTVPIVYYYVRVFLLHNS